MSSQKTLSQKATRESLAAPYDVHLIQTALQCLDDVGSFQAATLHMLLN
ncbi:hypothetical protein [Serratia entomophila]|nr:hypothetical protein [Serratia entomophila]CAI1001974.1 Uncharacterised protein [Serratia entomophila]CAI1778576.1 Uncharacterised protein [Serratia entomophila]CAI1839835.1 Uncharacterised protein [Serratia entomophila]